MSIFPSGAGQGNLLLPETQQLTTGIGATFTPSAGVRRLSVEIYGATGGGGGVSGGGVGTIGVAGSGGNGGYSEKTFDVAGQTFTYTIGAAGAGAAAGNNNGGDGGTTLFTGSLDGTVQVTGGGGGQGVAGQANGIRVQGAAGVGSGGERNITANAALAAYWAGGILYIFGNNGFPLLGFGEVSISLQDGADSGGYTAGGLGGFTSGDATNYAGGDGFSGLILVKEIY